MSPLQFVLQAFAASVVAGGLGALVGLGGGIIVIPALTLWLNVDIRYAIGASIVSVIATSSGAAARYLRDGLVNLRVAMVLEVATTAGALSGAFLAGHIGSRALYFIFAGVMAYSAVMMLRKREQPPQGRNEHRGPTGCVCTAVTSTKRPGAWFPIGWLAPGSGLD